MTAARAAGGPLRIGVLAVQGAFAERCTILRRIGVDAWRCACRSTSPGSAG